MVPSHTRVNSPLPGGCSSAAPRPGPPSAPSCPAGSERSHERARSARGCARPRPPCPLLHTPSCMGTCLHAAGCVCNGRGGCRSLGGGFCTLPILFVKGDALARSRRHLCTGRCLHLHTRQSLSVRRHTPPCSLCKGTRLHAPPLPPYPHKRLRLHTLLIGVFAHSSFLVRRAAVCTPSSASPPPVPLCTLTLRTPTRASFPHSPRARGRVCTPLAHLPVQGAPQPPTPRPPPPPPRSHLHVAGLLVVAERTRELRLQRARHLLLGGRLPLGLAAPHGRVGGGVGA